MDGIIHIIPLLESQSQFHVNIAFKGIFPPNMQFLYSGHSGRLSWSNLKFEDRFPKFVLNRSQYAFKHALSAGKKSSSENLPVLKECLNEYYELLSTNLGK